MASTNPASLTQTAYERLRADLLSCKLKPNEQLKISQLCEQLDVSLGAVREALSRLTSEGLVIAEPQRGFRVAPVSLDDLKDLTRVRIQIETSCLERAIACGDMNWETNLVAAFYRLSRTPERVGDGVGVRLDDTWREAHNQFHECLIAACDSPWLLRIRQQLYMQTERYRQLSVPLQKVKRDTNAEHQELMDAVLARDTAKAAQLLDAHLTRTMDILVAGFEPQASAADVTARARRKGAARGSRSLAAAD
ncbi:MAG TPA: GntR family transcriptional regulator [Paraburkholderia sp.]|nr:GntR family transcriptional regulator [Paraburkholderia sp.]